jgi:hypothetical protein
MHGETVKFFISFILRIMLKLSKMLTLSNHRKSLNYEIGNTLREKTVGHYK